MPTIARIVLFGLAAGYLSTHSAAQSPGDALEVGKAVERELKGGEKHLFRVDAAGNQFAHLVATQKGIDVVVRLRDAGGTGLMEIDSPNGANGPEPMWHVFANAGSYTVEIESLEKHAKAGKYELKLNELRAATPDDSAFVAAKMRVQEGISSGNLRDAAVRAKAIPKFREAAGLFEKLDDARRAAGFEQVGRLFGVAGENETALKYYDEAIALYLASGEKAKALNAMKAGQHWSLSRMEAIRRNEAIGELAASMGDRTTVAFAYRERAFNYFELGDFARSLENTKKSLQIAREINHLSLIESNYDNMGAVYNAQANYSAALESHLTAVALQSEAGKKPAPAAILNIGNVHMGLGNFELAIHNFENAYAEFEKNRISGGMAFAISNIGSAYLDMGQYDKALEYFLRAQPMKAKFMPDDPTSFYNIASVYRAKGQFREALDQANKAVELLNRTGDSDGLARTQIVISDIYWDLRDHEKALKHANKAIELSKKYDYPNHLWSAQLSAANALLNLTGRGADARRALEESTAAIDKLHEKFIGTEESAAEFYSKTDTPFKAIIGLDIEDGKAARALQIAEKLKARSLLGVLAAGKVNVTTAMTESEKATEAAMKLELASLNLQAAREQDKVKAETYRAGLEKARREYEDFKSRLYGSHPELRSQRGELPVFELAQGSELLNGRNAAILEFVADDDDVFLFVVDAQPNGTAGAKAYRIKIKLNDLSAEVESFRSKLAAGDLDFQNAARKVYDILLKPAAAELAGKTNLVIVPDGPLWDLPFQALMDEKGKYLVERAAISYAPSLTALREMSKKAKRRKGNAAAELLAFGNPIVGGETSERVKRVFMSEKLEPLPEAERLVNDLGKMYGASRSKVFTGNAATERIAKEEAPKYRFVQFATHGILNNASPMYSHLVFARGEKDAADDGLLEAWELKDLDLKADMVILTACETARGRVSGGEGMIGMTWASFIAGAPTTVASQWKVESRSTTELMLEFHRQLLAKKPVSKAEAMRRAALKVMRMPGFKHPSYWAGFVVVGDGN